MKTILGLDLGTTSIGWALVKEAENDNEKSSIVKIGVRVNPLTTDEKTNFEKGSAITTNADRTLKRGMRRNLQRFKLRREKLIKFLIDNNILNSSSILSELGKESYYTIKVRAKAAREKISLEDFARVLLTINKSRGYKSNRKSQTEDEGTSNDNMEVAKTLYEKNLTPGQYAFELLKDNKKNIPEFYRSDLKAEFDKIWKFQQQFYPTQLTNELYQALENKGVKEFSQIFNRKGVELCENKGKRDEVKLQMYKLRSKAIKEKLEIGEVAYCLSEINKQVRASSSLLGEISDRSKKLIIDDITVGEYLYNLNKENKNTSLKRLTFYRQDLIDEFDTIWDCQAQFYPELLTEDLKTQVRDTIIFYQRPLKSQKYLLSLCEFESWENKEHKKIGYPVIPKSSPLFQIFKIWQIINNTTIEEKATKVKRALNQQEREKLFNELNFRDKISESKAIKVIGLKESEYKLKYDQDLDGNRTNATLFNAFQKISENAGYGNDWDKRDYNDILNELKEVFKQKGLDENILEFRCDKENIKECENQIYYQIWHLLYATEDGNSIKQEDREKYGNTNVAIKKKLVEKYGFSIEDATIIASVTFKDDYGNLSSKAIKKIVPHLMDGKVYSDACELAGYNHSHSLTKEENENRELAQNIETIKKGDLRNPVVEKILNQMSNIINEIIEKYEKPDEVRIELARELKKSASERKEDIQRIRKGSAENENVKNILQTEFHISNPTKNDIIRYRLWAELKQNGYKDVFTNQYIDKNQLFSNAIDIEHIIPKALQFNDSYSNKTLAFKSINQKKSNRTAIDFISQDYHSELDQFKARVEDLYKNGCISKAKRNNLLTAQKDIKDGFIERDLSTTQYIAKYACQMLKKVVKTVTVTTGSITDRLRQDWEIVDIMRELNFPKYKALGLITTEKRFDVGKQEEFDIEVIKDWTKRNDHRHHAMDALTIAFTKNAYIQYINYLNARSDEKHKMHTVIMNIENKFLTIKGNKKVFKSPIDNFREVAKEHIANILVSIKAKNKVTTQNTNKTKKKAQYDDNHKIISKFNETVQLTPRGELHKETVYGKRRFKITINPTDIKDNQDIINIINPKLRNIVEEHLKNYNNNFKKAFSKATLNKTPLLLNEEEVTEINCYTYKFTIRKPISPDLDIANVVDAKVKEILENRLSEYNNDPKKAFSNLDTNPIWFNKIDGICIKSVRIKPKDIVPVALRHKRDNLGKEILDLNGNTIPNDYVATGANHHVAIYEDKDGNYQEKIVSFMEAVERINKGLSVVDKDYNKELGWKFVFSMKTNEMFVVKNDTFDPTTIELKDPKNYSQISPNMFRVQKISSKYYVFRHHLETTIDRDIQNLTFKRVTSINNLKDFIKVRINHLGEIVDVGEYD